MDALITEVLALGAGVKEFHLRRSDGAALPDWRAGAHVVLDFAARDGRRFEKYYSLVGRPGAGHAYRIAVQREEAGNGGSRCLHEEFGPGRTLGLRGPFNSFALADVPPGLPRVILVGGGIGITPLVSMAYTLGAQGQAFTLHYLARDRERLVFLDELQAIPGARIVTHVSGESGRIDPGALLGGWAAGDSLYACGPAPLLQALAEVARGAGWPDGAVHVESFGARPQSGDGPLTVALSLSGISVEVAPGTSILDALIAADVFVSWDCKRGECGSCYTEVLEGAPLHRDVCLTPAMRSRGMCTCVSWAAAPGRLVLAL